MDTNTESVNNWSQSIIGISLLMESVNHWNQSIIGISRSLGSVNHWIQSIIGISLSKIDSNTIDGNVDFVLSQYSCILTSQVSIQFLCPTKFLLIIVIV